MRNANIITVCLLGIVWVIIMTLSKATESWRNGSILYLEFKIVESFVFSIFAVDCLAEDNSSTLVTCGTLK